MTWVPQRNLSAMISFDVSGAQVNAVVRAAVRAIVRAAILMRSKRIEMQVSSLRFLTSSARSFEFEEALASVSVLALSQHFKAA